jgi:DHA3 family macrolide efflux protein-like MFS transporter
MLSGINEPPRAKLANRNFILLWQGQAISQLGDQAFSLAIVFWAVEKTGSATLMSLLLIAGTLPIILFGPVGGVVVDRLSRMRIIIACDLVGGIALLGLSLVMLHNPSTTDGILVLLFLVAFVLGCVRAFFQPAINAVIPDLVAPSRLAAANSLNLFSLHAAVLLGQAMGGVLYRLLGAPLLFFCDGLSFFFAAGCESLVKAPEGRRGSRPASGLVQFMVEMRAGTH